MIFVINTDTYVKKYYEIFNLITLIFSYFNLLILINFKVSRKYLMKTVTFTLQKMLGKIFSKTYKIFLLTQDKWKKNRLFKILNYLLITSESGLCFILMFYSYVLVRKRMCLDRDLQLN
jgi:hypothetical protein